MRFSEEGFEDRFAVVETLVGKGCTFEGATPRLIALDVPPELDHGVVGQELAELQAKGLLDYESCATSTPEDFGPPRTEHKAN